LKPEDPAAPPAETTKPEGGNAQLVAGELVGRYEILGLLGQGGMSVVYAAYDPELDRKVALKLMRVRASDESARRLQREAQALAKLSHPNVVPVYDAGLVGAQAFVAMEHVEGMTLRKWLKTRRTWREIVAVMVDAGRGLAAAHARGLIHRDFKPDNVLLGNDGRVRVLDFGLARLAGVLDGSVPPTSTPSLDSLPPPSGPRSSRTPGSAPLDMLVTRADQLVGTPAYMAPEQVRRDTVDERADIFAFGVTLFEALFGVRPFDAPRAEPVGSTAATITAHVSDDGLHTPRAIPRGSHVPRHIQRVVIRALAYKATDRFPDVDTMLKALTHDPYRAWGRGAALGAVVLGATAVGVALFRAPPQPLPACHGGAQRMSAVMSADARTAITDGFTHTGLVYANDAASAALRELDGYATRLAHSVDDACAATRLRGEQSEEAMDLRMACYDSRWREVGALLDLLRKPDEDVVKSAARAARALSPLDDCADVAALRAPTPRPRDPRIAQQVEALQQRLANVKARYDLGKATEAASLADALLDDARRVAFIPLVARVEFWRARANADLNESNKSIPAFRGAFADALASHEDRILKDSAARLAQEYIYARQPAEFDYWASVAQAAIDRGPPDDKLQSFLDHTRCVALWAPGLILTRLDCLEKNAAKVERLRPLDEWELTTLGLAAVDVGQFDRGIDYARRGYEYSLRQNGPSHPRTLEMRMYQCKARLDSGDTDAALAECGAILQAIQAEASDNAALVARMRLYTVDALNYARRYDEARAELARARAAGADESEVLLSEAEIDVATGHAAHALPHLREALAEETKELRPEHPDVIGAEVELGRALLAHGDVAEARTLMESALAAAGHAELMPIGRADVEFTLARAIVAADPRSRARALSLAEQARDRYVATAPATRRYLDERKEIEDWLARWR
jgi:eukaryotic-like serine/threonine-protein kinase